MRVTVEGIGPLEFPDGTDEAVVERTVRDLVRERTQNDPARVEAQRAQMGWAPNAGALEGVAGYLGLPSALAGITGSVAAATTRGAGRVGGWLGIEGAPEAANAASDVLERGAASLDQRVGSAAIARGLRDATGLANVQPQTGLGRVAAGAIQGAVPAMIAPGSALANAAVGASSGALAAGAAEGGAPAWVQGGAALVPPLAAAGVAGFLRARSPMRAATQALEDLTPAERQMLGTEVPRRMQEARQALGTGRDPAITWTEAAQAGLKRPVDALQRAQGLAQSSYGGGQVMSRMGARSEGAARDALETTRRGLQPSADVLEQAGSVLRDTADLELGGLSRVAKAPARALYDAARMEVASSPIRQAAVDAAVNRAVQELDRIAAGNPFLTTQAQRLADRMALGTLDWDTMNTARRSIREATMQMTERGRVLDEDLGREAGAIIRTLTAELEQASPTFRQAQREYARAMRREVEPAKAGPLGDISRTSDLDQQTRALTRELSPRRTENVMGRLAGPQAERSAVDIDAPEMAGAILSRAVEQRLAPLQGNPSGQRAASFIDGMTDTERANMRALFMARPGGQQAWEGFSKMLDTLEAMAYRPRRATASDAAMGEMMGQAKQGSVTRWVMSPVRMLGDTAERFRMNGSTRDLAENLISEDGFRTLHRLAMEPDAIRRAYLVRSIVALGLPEEAE